MHSRAITLLLVSLILLGACREDEATICYGPKVFSPDGACFANYAQTKRDEGITTQALFTCNLRDSTEGGGNLVAYANSVTSGVGIFWKNNSTIVLLISSHAQLSQNTVSTPKEVQLGARRIEVLHEVMPPNHVDQSGCFANSP